MLKNIKPKDVVEFFLFGLAFLALIVIAGYLDSAPIGQAIWVAVGLAVVLWLIWLALVARDRNRETARPKLKMMRNGQWVDVDTRVDPSNLQRTAQFFDQDEAAAHHLDFNKKEQA